MRRGVNQAAIIVILFLLIGLIWGLDAFRRAFIKPPAYSSLENGDSESGYVSDTEAPETSSVQVTEPDLSGYDIIHAGQNEISSGQLVLVNSDYQNKTQVSGDELTDFKDKNEYYRLKDFELKVRDGLVDKLNLLFSDFYGESSLKNIMIMKAYDGSSNESEFSTGYAVEMRLLNDDGSNSVFSGEGKYAWILDNCHKYGFAVRYPDRTPEEGGTGQLRYVGSPHSQIMAEKELSLEGYHEFIKEFTYDNPYLYESCQVYYVKAGGNGADIPVPRNSSYTVSGNNSDGFIVTVTSDAASGD